MEPVLKEVRAKLQELQGRVDGIGAATAVAGAVGAGGMGAALVAASNSAAGIEGAAAAGQAVAARGANADGAAAAMRSLSAVSGASAAAAAPSHLSPETSLSRETVNACRNVLLTLHCGNPFPEASASETTNAFSHMFIHLYCSGLGSPSMKGAALGLGELQSKLRDTFITTMALKHRVASLEKHLEEEDRWVGSERIM